MWSTEIRSIMSAFRPKERILVYFHLKWREAGIFTAETDVYVYPALIAGELDMSPMTVARTLSKLEKSGLVESIGAKGGKKVRLYKLSEKGSKLVKDVLENLALLYDDIIGRPHVSGICIDTRSKPLKVLLVKRSELKRYPTDSTKLFPDFWECGGGRMYLFEDYREAVVRHFREGMGVIVEPLKPFRDYTVGYAGKTTPGIIFYCIFKGYVNKKGVELSREYVDYRWQDISKIGDIELIPKLKEEIEEALAIVKTVSKEMLLGQTE